jgi:hypothetical protein
MYENNNNNIQIGLARRVDTLMPHNIERLETPSSGPHCQVLRCPNALVCTAGSSPKSSITAFCDHDAQLSLSGTCTELRRLLLTCGRPQYDGTRVINRTQRMKGIHSMEVLSMLPFPFAETLGRCCSLSCDSDTSRHRNNLEKNMDKRPSLILT